MRPPPRGDTSAKKALDPPTRAPVNLYPASRTAERDRGANNMINQLTGVVADFIAAVNAFDTDAIVATFAADAYVNDNRREISGVDAIRRFIAKEFVGDHLTMEVREVIDHYGDIIVRAKFDGTYDKTNLPEELVMSSYFSVRDNKIVSLAVIFNQPSGY
jgi:limonene-1,2-epoxide hydrolase